jgi:hypothetical protein
VDAAAVAGEMIAPELIAHHEQNVANGAHRSVPFQTIRARCMNSTFPR